MLRDLVYHLKCVFLKYDECSQCFLNNREKMIDNQLLALYMTYSSNIQDCTIYGIQHNDEEI